MRDKNEIFGARHVSEKCPCKTCFHADGSPPFANGWRKASCMIYQDPQTKPSDVYYDGAECEYYEKRG